MFLGVLERYANMLFDAFGRIEIFSFFVKWELENQPSRKKMMQLSLYPTIGVFRTIQDHL